MTKAKDSNRILKAEKNIKEVTYIQRNSHNIYNIYQIRLADQKRMKRDSQGRERNSMTWTLHQEYSIQLNYHSRLKA